MPLRAKVRERVVSKRTPPFSPSGHNTQATTGKASNKTGAREEFCCCCMDHSHNMTPSDISVSSVGQRLRLRRSASQSSAHSRGSGGGPSAGKGLQKSSSSADDDDDDARPVCDLLATTKLVLEDLWDESRLFHRNRRQEPIPIFRPAGACVAACDCFTFSFAVFLFLYSLIRYFHGLLLSLLLLQKSQLAAYWEWGSMAS